MSTSKNASGIGHFARIPLHVARAPVSETAKAVWRELAFFSSPEKPVVFVKQAFIAKSIKRSTKTVQRALKELLAAGLLSFAGWLEGRYKRYKMAWRNTSDKTVRPPQTLMSDDRGHSCPPIIRDAKQTKEQIISATSVLEKHEQELQRRFPCLDGKSGRPTLNTCIEQALNHKAKEKYKDLKIYLEMWLQNAAHRWRQAYIKDSGVFVESNEAFQTRLSWEQRRREWDEREAALYFTARDPSHMEKGRD